MIVFTDKDDRIIAYGSTDKQYKHKIDVGDFFDDKCEAVILGYKCIPGLVYEVDENGRTVLDENGKPIPVMGDDGKQKANCQALTADVPYLEIYQSAYETMTLALADLIGGAYE